MLASRANVSIVPAQPPTYANWDNYLVPSLQAVYDFSASKSRIKAVLLCNPHNPLSRCYPKKALLEVMEFCQEHGLHLIVDEIYGCLELGGGEGGFVSALELVEPLRREGAVKVEASRVHVVWSASKVFGMSGFRVVRTLSPSYTRTKILIANVCRAASFPSRTPPCYASSRTSPPRTSQKYPHFTSPPSSHGPNSPPSSTSTPSASQPPTTSSPPPYASGTSTSSRPRTVFSYSPKLQGGRGM